ncbi:MAG: DUF4350 domain-containing protein [Myxococcota bacterium]|jgi:hypothetical protein|nr:DUF4350 domain-containing protein [Myxococcota bacterium]
MNERRQPFKKPALVLIFGYGAVSLLFAVLLGWLTDPRADVKSIDTDTFSKSAIGHGALADLLDDQGYWTKISRWESGDEARFASLLILAEPHVMRGGDKELHKKMRATLAASPQTLLVLPKRDGLPSDNSWEEEWIGAVMHVPEYDVQLVLDMAKITTTPKRVWKDASEVQWNASSTALGTTPNMPDMQLLRQSAKLEPLIWNEHGILFARVKDGGSSGGELYVLSDPDIIANHGLHEPENATLAINIIERARRARGRIVIDEVLHGHEQIPTLWQQLLRFPMVLGTAQVAILLFFILWAGVLRFGPARREEEVHRPGKRFFIDNTAELLTLGGHSTYMLERYVWMMLGEVAFKLNAPSHLEKTQLVVWLQQQADRKGVEIDLHKLTQTVMIMTVEEKRVRPQRLLVLARQTYRFHKAMIDES